MTKRKGIFKKRVNKGNRFSTRQEALPDEDPTAGPSTSRPITSRPKPKTPKVVVPPSASVKKLGSSATKFDEFLGTSENIIIDFGVLRAMFDNVSCK